MPLSSVLGNQARLWYDAYDLSQFVNSIDLGDSLAANDVTCLTDTAVTEDPGLGDVSIKAAGFLDMTALTGSEVILQTAFHARRQAPLTVPLTGAGALGARCRLTNTAWGAYNTTIAVGDVDALDMEWLTRDGLFAGYILAALAQVSGAGTTFTSPVDYGAISAGGYAAALHVTAASGSGGPTLTVTVQSSATSGGTYADAFSFTVVSGVTPVSEYKSALAVTMQRWRRLKLVLAGTTPAYTFGVALAGRA